MVLSKSKTMSLGRADRNELCNRGFRFDGILEVCWNAKLGTAIQSARITRIALMIDFLDKLTNGLPRKDSQPLPEWLEQVSMKLMDAAISVACQIARISDVMTWTEYVMDARNCQTRCNIDHFILH